MKFTTTMKTTNEEVSNTLYSYDEAALDTALLGLLKHVFVPGKPLKWTYENILYLLEMMDKRKNTIKMFNELFEYFRERNTYMFYVKAWDNFYYLPSARKRALVKNRRAYIARVCTIDKETLDEFYKDLVWVCNNKGIVS